MKKIKSKKIICLKKIKIKIKYWKIKNFLKFVTQKNFFFEIINIMCKEN